MPVGTHGGNSLTNLRYDQCHLFFWYPANIDLDMQCFVRTEFSNDSARQDIQVLETLDYARDRAGISGSAPTRATSAATHSSNFPRARA